MICRNIQMSGTALDHRQNGGQDTAYRPNLLTTRIFRGWHRKKVPEQLIGSVY
jgi:hypothetical protein